MLPVIVAWCLHGVFGLSTPFVQMVIDQIREDLPLASHG